MRQSTCLTWLGAALLAVSAHAAEVVKVGSTPGVTSDAVQALVPEVDLAAGRIIVRDLPGLLDPQEG